MTSLYDIAFDFLNKYYNAEPSGDIKRATLKEFADVLSQGWTSEEINKKLNGIPHNNNSVPYITSIFPRCNGRDGEVNILKPGTFYYHNLLRSCPPPPTQNWDINTGVIQTISEPFYLETRASITTNQLVEYYAKQMKITVDSGNFNRFRGSFKYMLDKHGIDLVLFMIDTARDMIQGEDLPKPLTPVGVAEHITEAEARLNFKIDENRATGDDKIVAKRRVFNYRGGC